MREMVEKRAEAEHRRQGALIAHDLLPLRITISRQFSYALERRWSVHKILFEPLAWWRLNIEFWNLFLFPWAPLFWFCRFHIMEISPYPNAP